MTAASSAKCSSSKMTPTSTP
ncbi:hypothetical protein CCACVL1_11010 [Corchorus capsularis]|uniref:Uncharacterized protein n=1 Tax=Corchorus capsularis TaxID=210143 RepID=A0A1R3IND1_COCAP|nr:hypothetical protein CCACVL1_11010 [Corchorus capsularis]